MALTNRRPDEWPDQSSGLDATALLFGEADPGAALAANVGTFTVQSLATLIIALIVDGSPAALDTLNELAAALGDNPNFATDVLAAIGTKAAASEPFVTTAATGGLSSETAIGSIILAPDVIANRPAADSVVAGAIYLSTDTHVLARSTGAAWVVMVDLSGTYGQLALPSTGTAGAPVASAWTQWQVARSTDNKLWLCTVGGTPGTWVQMGLLPANNLSDVGSAATARTNLSVPSLAATTDLIDTAGDSLTGTADNTLGKLAKGTAFQTRRMNSAANAEEWASGGMQLIAETVLGSDTASVDFSSIPATFRHLRLLITARSDVAADNDNVYLNFNNDTTNANYDRQRNLGAAGATNFGESLATSTSSRLIGIIAGATSPTSHPGVVVVDLPYYAATSYFKIALGNGMAWRARTTGTLSLGPYGFGWASTAAINRITALPAAGSNLKTGSTISLYGIG